MDKETFISKTITRKRGYKWYSYSSEYNEEDEIFTIYHYNNPIFYFSLTKNFYLDKFKIKLGEYASSYSDKKTIYTCFYVLEEFVNEDFWYKFNVIRPSLYKYKFFKIYWNIIQDNGSFLLLERKSPNIYTLYNYQPWIKKRVLFNMFKDSNYLKLPEYVTKLKTYDLGKRRRKGIGRNKLIWGIQRGILDYV